MTTAYRWPTRRSRSTRPSGSTRSGATLLRLVTCRRLRLPYDPPRDYLRRPPNAVTTSLAQGAASPALKAAFGMVK